MIATIRIIIIFPIVVAMACAVLVLHSIKALAGDLEDALLAVANWLIDWGHGNHKDPDPESLYD